MEENYIPLTKFELKAIELAKLEFYVSQINVELQKIQDEIYNLKVTKFENRFDKKLDNSDTVNILEKLHAQEQPLIKMKELLESLI